MIVRPVGRRSILFASAATLAAMLAAQPVAAITINDRFTPAQVIDATNITGVGQMVTDQGGGFVGLCTGTLINPRTVLFAAHCVNGQPPGSYGAASGGTPIGFGFQADDRAALLGWLRPGPGQYRTDTSSAFYNANAVVYDALSLNVKIGGSGFLQADLAMASLDTPASAIPTWTLLFSALPAPAAAPGPNGTGYHVAVTGYGSNGTGTTGQAGGVDFRRRSAENLLGILGSIDDQDGFLFGEAIGLPQSLYQIDFDDPKRGAAAANRFDFNVFRDNALAREGITGPGDSGGPLILDQAFSRPVVIGVLSGGDRFFTAQPGASYGTTAFYQPLYLFWDWIVANNPYRYVSAIAGNGRWSDPAHWVNGLDPAYQVLGAGGQPLNGLPTTTPAGVTGTTPRFGQVCYQDTTSSECRDLATGRDTVTSTPIGQESAALTSLGSVVEGSALTPAALNTTGAPTPIPGLPGAPSGVPNNTDGAPAAGLPARYFDVTLSAAGVTSLDTSVTVDRLSVRGAAGLNVSGAGRLTSLVDITQTGGMVSVDGRLQSGGDYALIAGLLQGTGTVAVPFLTSAAGVIAPGTIGGVGRLSVQGDVVLASGAQLAIDVGANGRSDLLAIQANPAGGNRGLASLGGALLISPIAGYRPRFGDQFTVLTAEGGVRGDFAAVNALSAILVPRLSVSAGAVSARIEARPYAGVIDPGSPVQRAYATLLDAGRPAYATLSTLYGELDLLSVADLRPTLEAMAPHAEITRTSLARMQQGALSRLYRDRSSVARAGSAPGTLAVIGRPLLLAQEDPRSGPGGAPVGPEASLTPTAPIRLPEAISGFIAGGYLDGDARALPSGFSAGVRDQLSGWYVAGGIEGKPSPWTTLGAAFAYAKAGGRLRTVSQADSTLFELAAYGAYDLPRGVFVGAQGTIGAVESTTQRTFGAGVVAYRLSGADTSPTMSFEVNAGKDVQLTRGLTLTPTASLRYAHLEVGPMAETGGDAALAFSKRNLDSLEARSGVTLRGAFRVGQTTVIPKLHAVYVHDFGGGGGDVTGGFFAGAGGTVAFSGPDRSRDWGEIGGGVSLRGGPLALDLSADTNLGRGDLSYASYRASVRYSF